MRIARADCAPTRKTIFEIYSNDSLKSAFTSVAGIVRIGAFVVSFIALLAAGIGIMNIMLVSVTETNEGNRCAVNRSGRAQSRDVLRQFLTEAVFISGSRRNPRNHSWNHRRRPAGSLAQGRYHLPLWLGHRRPSCLLRHRHRLRTLPGVSCSQPRSYRGVCVTNKTLATRRLHLAKDFR